MMPIQMKCTCGKQLLIPDGATGKKVICPACRAVLDPHPSIAIPARGKTGRDSTEPLKPIEEPVEVTPGREKPSRKRRRHARERRQGLNQVNRGLALHHASAFAVYGGTLAVTPCAILLVAYRLTENDQVESALGFFSCLAGTFLLLAGLIELIVIALCLWAPAAGARSFLFGSLAAWAGVLALAVWVFWPDDHRPFALAGAFLGLLGAWTLWMLFLRRLAVYLEQEELAGDTVRTLVRGLATLLLAVIFLTLAILFVLLVVHVGYPFVRFMLCIVALSTFLGLMRVAAASRYFESMLHFVLFPTGILFVFKYLDLIGSMRMVIWRRS
jgi:hypothetical protein